jgi:hypothetical protein
MSDEIEIVAMAIREAFGNRSGRGCDWDKLKPQLRDQYRAEAKAAITALEWWRRTKMTAA